MTEEDLDHTKLGFGKYEGQTPDQIADHDPSYIVWLREKIVPAVVSKALADDCEQEMRESDAEERPSW